MAARTAEQKVFFESGPFLHEVWAVTGTYVAGTDTLNAVRPNKLRIVKAVNGNFDSYTVSSGAYTFAFASGIDKPWVEFIGFGR